MRFVACSVLGTALAASSGMGVMAQTAAPPVDVAATRPEVTFKFERVGVPVPHYTILLREDGTGRYQADEAVVSPSMQSSSAMQYTGGRHIDRPMTLSPATTEKIFKTARALNFFNVECASKAKNIANTGNKTLSYAGSDGKGSCEYNYSDNKSVSTLTDMFLAIAFTIDEGRRLEFLHRYDHLGMDAEINSLASEVQAGRAMELGTIAPTLDAIAGDGALMQRVRLRAEKLLEQSKDK
jgi:hypothetical protein